MEANQFIKDFGIISTFPWTIEFAHNMTEHAQKRSMMQTNGNEKQKKNTIREQIRNTADQARAYFSNISPWSSLIPGQTVIAFFEGKISKHINCNVFFEEM